MVKPPTFDSNGMKRGAWSKEEDERLRAFVAEFGHNNWRLLPLLAGLSRCGKSCRLRWVNYLKPGLKREKFTNHESDVIIRFHNQLGNKWSAIAAKLPGRTDNEIKNYWHAHIKKRGRRAAKINNNNNNKTPPPPLKEEEEEEEEELSSSSSSCLTIDDYKPSPPKMEPLSPIADLYTFARARGDLPVSDLPPFPAEEFRDFDFLFQEMQNESSNSSDGGSSFCSSSSADLNNFWGDQSFGEDILDIKLW